MNRCAQGVHLFVVNAQGVFVERTVRGKILEQRIALCHHLVVFDEVLKIYLVRLGNYPVHELSAGVAAFQNQVAIRWGNNH